MRDPMLMQRAMTLGDLPQVLALERLAQSTPWTEGNFRDSMREGLWMQVLVQPRQPWQPHAHPHADQHTAQAVSAAEGGDVDTVLAFCVAQPGVDAMCLLDLAVRPENRRAGLAKRLLQALVQDAQRLGQGAIWLEVRASNVAAQRLYTTLGWQTVGRRRGFYRLPTGGREDALLYNLSFVPSSAAPPSTSPRADNAGSDPSSSR